MEGNEGRGGEAQQDVVVDAEGQQYRGRERERKGGEEEEVGEEGREGREESGHDSSSTL